MITQIVFSYILYVKHISIIHVLHVCMCLLQCARYFQLENICLNLQFYNTILNYNDVFMLSKHNLMRQIATHAQICFIHISFCELKSINKPLQWFDV